MTDDIDDDFEIPFANIGRPAPEDKEERDGMYAEGRLTNRTYASRSFPLRGVPGVPAKFVNKVFEPESDTEVEPFGEGEVWLVRESPKGRVQLKLLVAREAGHVSHLWIQRISHSKGVARAENTLSLGSADAERLIELMRNLDMAAVYAGATLLIETPSGILADRWSRKGVLVLAGIALLLNALVAGLSHDVPTYIASALILAVYFALTSGTVDSIVYDAVLEETGNSDGFEERLGRVRVLTSITSVAGALAGGVLAQLVEPRLAYFATIPFMAISVVALLRFREPRLHKAAEATSIGAHIRTTLRAVSQGGALVPITAILVTTAVLLQVILEFGPLWLVPMAAPTFLYGPHGAGLLSSFGLGGMLGGRVRPVDQLPSTALVVGLMLVACVVLVAVHDSVAATIAQVVLASLLVAVSIAFTRLLHDAIPSNVRAGVSSAVGSLTWMAFLPFALLFGAISKTSGVFDAGWLIVAATVALSVVLVRTALARRVSQPPHCDLAAMPRAA